MDVVSLLVGYGTGVGTAIGIILMMGRSFKIREEKIEEEKEQVEEEEKELQDEKAPVAQPEVIPSVFDKLKPDKEEK